MPRAVAKKVFLHGLKSGLSEMADQYSGVCFSCAYCFAG
jgi:hypothetical protein